MTVEEKIERALFDRVDSFVHDPPLLVSMPNVPFPEDEEPPETYLEVSHLRNTNERFATKSNGTNRLSGILQITVISPLSNGPSYSTRIAGAVSDHFYSGLVLFHDGVRVNISERPSVATPIKDRDVSWNVPVSIRYDALS